MISRTGLGAESSKQGLKAEAWVLGAESSKQEGGRQGGRAWARGIPSGFSQGFLFVATIIVVSMHTESQLPGVDR